MIQGLPCQVVTECVFGSNDVQTSRTLNSGGQFSLTTGQPFWTADVRIDAPNRQAFAMVDAWLTARQLSKNPFLMGRRFASIPRGGDVDDSSLDVVSVDTAAGTVTLSGAGAYSAKAGDMLSYYTAAGGYWLGMILENASVAPGYEIELSVWPTPATPHASTPAPRRRFAFGEFYIDGRISKSEGIGPRYFEFSARQLIRIAGDDVCPITPPDQGDNLSTSETLIL